MKMALKPISRIYQTGVSLRNYLYNSNKLPKITPPIFTISVGNISWGGTGKTPVCEYLLNLAHKNRLKPLLLSRGYRGKPPFYPYVVEDSTPVSFSGDEPLMLKNLCPFSVVIVDPKRERGMYFAWNKFKPDIGILDDGFQYKKLKKHVNILLFSHDDLDRGWNKLIPYGTWREDENSITHADILMINITGKDINKIKPMVTYRLQKYNKPIFFFNTKAISIVSIDKEEEINRLPDRYILVTGIGNPDKAYYSVKKLLKQEPIKFFRYKDHYNYKKKDWIYIYDFARKNRACIITTPKDAVKLRKFSLSLYVLKIKTEIISALNTHLSFDDFILQAFFKYKSSH